MNGIPHNPENGPRDQELHTITLEEGLEDLRQALHLDPVLADAFDPQRTEVHFTGLPDLDEAHLDDAHKIKLLTVKRSLVQLTAVSRFVGGRRIDDLNKDDVSHLKAGIENGMLQVGSLVVPWELDTLNYYPAIKVGIEPRPLGARDMQLLFGTSVPSQGVLEPERLAARSRDVGLPDYSEATLNARFSHFLDVMQVDFALKLIDDFYFLAKLGNQDSTHAHPLRSFIAKNAPKLGQDDIIEKFRIHYQLNTFFEAAKGDEEYGHIYRLLAKRTSNTNAIMLELVRYYGKAYDYFGYGLPRELKERYAVLLNKLELPEATPPDHGPEIRQIHEEVVRQFEAAEEPWKFTTHFSRGERKQFSGMQRQLILGFQPQRGEPIPGIPKNEAQQIIGILGCLKRLGAADSLAQAQEELADRFLAFRRMAEEFTRLQTEAEQNVPSFQLSIPAARTIESLCEAIRDNWLAYHELITLHWPGEGGIVVARNIHRLLFDFTSQEEVIESPAERIRRLHAVVLPPQPTEDDIDREVRRQGIRRRLPRVKVQRIKDLAELRDEYEGEMFFSDSILQKTTPEDEAGLQSVAEEVDASAIKSKSYCILVITTGGQTIAVAEPLFRERSTYVVADPEWLEILKLNKEEARTLGAASIPHTQAQYGPDHMRKIRETIEKLRNPRR